VVRSDTAFLRYVAHTRTPTWRTPALWRLDRMTHPTSDAKYASLLAHLNAQGASRVAMRVADMRDKLGIAFPSGAYTATFWRGASKRSSVQACLRGGWRVTGYVRLGGVVTFEHGADLREQARPLSGRFTRKPSSS
jgi:hypothetical protein